MIFSIVVPAYNEEESVVEVLRGCLKAGEALRARAGVSDLEILLVSDGSTDRTAERARSVSGVTVIELGKNKGYGAAVKAGFSAARGEWLGFLDADETCDPGFFVELLSTAQKENLDVVLGSRMHAGSKMPAVRVLGNWVFRTIINVIAESSITDTASGMRVLKRSALARIYPLPDGLHFTPAMSVRAVLDAHVSIGECPMPYRDRAGQSKLSVFSDGFRFLRVICETALTFRPLKFFGWGAGFIALGAGALLIFRLGGPTAAPIPFYLENERIADWMLFRLMLSSVLLTVSVFLAALGVVAQTLIEIINHEAREANSRLSRVVRFFPWLGAGSCITALYINRRPLSAYWLTGEIPSEFWVFPVVGAFFVVVGFELLAFSVVAEIARLLQEREDFRRMAKQASR